MMTCTVLFLIVVASTLENGRAMPAIPALAAARAPGDFVIGGIIPVHLSVKRDHDNFSPHRLEQCVRFDKDGFVRTLGMINAIEVMNKSPMLADIGVTLGYRIYDSCSDVSTALRATADLTRQGDCDGQTNTSVCNQPVIAVIGASSSEKSIIVARQLTLDAIPQISYASTAIILSDKTRFPVFLRTVPNDSHQTAAMVQLMKDNNWSWVGVLTTDGDYGRSALDSFVSQATELGICVAFKSIFPQSLTSAALLPAVRKAVKAIRSNSKATVIVSFVKPTQMKQVFSELREQTEKAGHSLESMKRVWMASDSWSFYRFLDQQLKLDELGHVVGFTFKHGDLSSLNHYLKMLEHNSTGNNPFLEELYAQSNASGDTQAPTLGEILKGHVHSNKILSVEIAVSAIANAVASLCRSRDCKRPGTVQPWELLRTLRTQGFKLRERSFKFDINGDINQGYDIILWKVENGAINISDIVAEYDPMTNSLNYTNEGARKRLLGLRSIISKCSDSCMPGQSMKVTEGQHTCCYECINCTENYFSNDTDMDKCLSCDSTTEWSPEGSSHCFRKTLVFFSWEDSFAVVLLVLTSLGLVLVLLVGTLFLMHRHTPVVKAAGGPLCLVILLSLWCSFISAAMFMGRPTNLQCMARQVVFALSFTLCVSCILVKSLKILLAFQFNPGLQELLRRLYQPYVIIAFCVAAQVAICTTWLVLKRPFYNLILYPTKVLAECHEGSYEMFGAMLGYIALLALTCFICAYKGRKLPQKYNEAKFITFSMLLYLMSWLIFIPVYVTTSGMYVPAVEGVVILISNYGILSCHFFPKCYVILFKREQNTASAFKKNIYEYSKKKTGCVDVPDGGTGVPPVAQPAAEQAVVKSNEGTKDVQSSDYSSIASGSVTAKCHKCHKRLNSI